MSDGLDLVQRLRNWEAGAAMRPTLYDEAADRIEAIEAALAVKDSHDHFDCAADRTRQRLRIEALEAALRSIADWDHRRGLGWEGPAVIAREALDA